MDLAFEREEGVVVSFGARERGCLPQRVPAARGRMLQQSAQRERARGEL